MMPLLLRAALTLAAPALLAGAAVWQVQAWRMDEVRAQAQQEQAQAQQELAHWQAEAQRLRAEALEAAREREQQQRQQLDEAQHEHQIRQARLRADGVAARAELERLRERLAQPAAARPGFAGDTAPAACGACATTGDVLAACAQEYIDMAEQADRHAADVTLLLDGWPR